MTAIFLLVVMNRRDLLGDHVNGKVGNLLGGLVVLAAITLGLYNIASALGIVDEVSNDASSRSDTNICPGAWVTANSMPAARSPGMPRMGMPASNRRRST